MVSLSTNPQLSRFLAVAKSRPSLASAVRQLRVIIKSDATRGDIVHYDLPTLLSRCSRLYELDLATNLPTFADSVLAELRNLPCRPTALRCTNLQVEASQVPYQLARIWQDSLRFLVLGGEPFHLIRSPPPTDLPAPRNMKLKEFRWTSFDRPSADVLRWFLGSQPGDLRYLSLDCLPDEESFHDLLRIHGPNLISLRLRDLFGVEAESLAQCTGLEEFSLDRGMDEHVLSVLAHQNGPNWPSTFTHLEFGVRVKTPESQALENAVQRAVQSGRFPNLKTITLKQWGGTWSLESVLKRWKALLPEIEVLDGSTKRTPEQRKKSTSKVRHIPVLGVKRSDLTELKRISKDAIRLREPGGLDQLSKEGKSGELPADE
ncbi:hypothetical protein FRB90_010231 [Tulasnella sp. 427]|nr:hypothetical protein FRB90_010231 [Tulasnella sp. 427]